MKNDLKNEYVDSNRIEGGKVALYVKIHGVWKKCCRYSKNYNFANRLLYLECGNQANQSGWKAIELKNLGPILPIMLRNLHCTQWMVASN